MSTPEETIKRAELLQRAGDHKRARRLAREAIEQTPVDAAVYERAEKILEASGIDPVAIAVFGLSLGVLLLLIIWYVL
ncbi:MAG: tetratricopeptide repeat protein [Deltaproteobacteria bacterium]|nr:tetratricopeptide repeat protein [Deltaproteobacteria bacterium]